MKDRTMQLPVILTPYFPNPATPPPRRTPYVLERYLSKVRGRKQGFTPLARRLNSHMRHGSHSLVNLPEHQQSSKEKRGTHGVEELGMEQEELVLASDQSEREGDEDAADDRRVQEIPRIVGYVPVSTMNKNRL